MAVARLWNEKPIPSGSAVYDGGVETSSTQNPKLPCRACVVRPWSFVCHSTGLACHRKPPGPRPHSSPPPRKISAEAVPHSSKLVLFVLKKIPSRTDRSSSFTGPGFLGKTWDHPVSPRCGRQWTAGRFSESPDPIRPPPPAPPRAS